MNRKEKIQLLKKLTTGEVQLAEVNKQPIGPVLIQLNENEFKCSSTGQILTSKEVEKEGLSNNVKVSFVLPDNGRD